MGFVYNVTVRAESGASFQVDHLTNFDTQLNGVYDWIVYAMDL
jgi:hypothetical protein